VTAQTRPAPGASLMTVRPGGRAFSIAVIVPVSHGADSLVELYRDYSEPLRAQSGWSFEFVVVAEPWYRDLTSPLVALAARGERIRVFHVGQSVGETTLLRVGLANTDAEIVVVLPAYRRVEPAALRELVQRVSDGADLAVARRWPRRDPWINRLQTRAFHALIGGLADGRLHDVACGVSAMRREVLERAPLYGDLLRFLPVFAIRQGYQLEEIAAAQHAADGRARVHGPGTYLRRLVDLLGLVFLLRFTEKPLRFFGLIGGLLTSGGGAVLTLLLLQRLAGRGIADRPLLLLGVLLVVLGVQAIALGLIGEIVVHLHAGHQRGYRLRDAASRTDRPA